MTISIIPTRLAGSDLATMNILNQWLSSWVMAMVAPTRCKVGRPYTKYTDITNAVSTTIVTNADGWGDFACQGGSVSGWVLV
jgi:hypothetical protein